MNIRELKIELDKYPEDMEVWVRDYDGNVTESEWLDECIKRRHNYATMKYYDFEYLLIS